MFELSMRQVILKLLPCLLATALLVACGVRGVPLPPSLELPQPVTDLRAARKGDRVYLAWTVPTRNTDGESVRRPGMTVICRSLDAVMNECGTLLAKVQTLQPPPPSPPLKNAPPMKITATYIDSGPLPPASGAASEATYAVEVLNENGRSGGLSNLVRVPVFPAVPPPANFNATVTAAGVRISWQCEAVKAIDDVQYKLRIYRRSNDGQAGNDQAGASQTGVSQANSAQAFMRIDEADFSDCSKAELLDQTFEWEKTYAYRAHVVTVISQPGKPAIEIEGDDTPIVEVVARDVFPPGIPTGLQAVASGVGQAPFVDLIWAPVTDGDIAGYNLYRHQEGEAPVKINADLVKIPAFRDTTVVPGKKYFYSVSAVDLRGNESAPSEETSEVAFSN